VNNGDELPKYYKQITEEKRCNLKCLVKLCLENALHKIGLQRLIFNVEMASETLYE
jgi:hypothetical protein